MAIIYGISIILVDFCTANGTMTDAIPRISRIFIILLPTTFPTVIPSFPFRAEVILTAASGALVPMATIVRPITSCGMPSRKASAEDPSTNQSAPLVNITKPTINNAIAIKMFIVFSSFLFSIIMRFKKTHGSYIHEFLCIH